MRRLTVAVILSLLAITVVVTPTIGSGQTSGSEATPITTEAVAPVTKVSHRVIKPKRVFVVRVKFTPWAQPTPAQVHQIIRAEAYGRATVSYLSFRIRCESTFNWAAQNGQYAGLGQYASSTFYRGMTTIGKRRVQLVSTRTRVKRSRIREHWSDGTRTQRYGGRYRQVVKIIRSGVIPKSPPMTHGWAQVRIMAQAMNGHSAVNDGEWDPKCR
jgi:hypothetical protein